MSGVKKEPAAEATSPKVQVEYSTVVDPEQAELRRQMILRALKTEGPMTARELAYYLGFTERNATAPRLTELERAGKVEIIGKQADFITKKSVNIYALV